MFTKGEQCSERISDYTGYHRSQCSRKAVVQREGKPYCKIHDPEYIKAKRDARYKQYDDEAAKRAADCQRLVVISNIFQSIETTQIEQDAKKYKAAPELYEACKKTWALMWKEGIPEVSMIVAYDSPIIKVLRQAIAAVEKGD